MPAATDSIAVEHSACIADVASSVGILQWENRNSIEQFADVAWRRSNDDLTERSLLAVNERTAALIVMMMKKMLGEMKAAVSHPIEALAHGLSSSNVLTLPQSTDVDDDERARSTGTASGCVEWAANLETGIANMLQQQDQTLVGDADVVVVVAEVDNGMVEMDKEGMGKEDVDAVTMTILAKKSMLMMVSM
jgi:hypothetical protein